MLGHHLVNTPLGRRPTFGHGWLNKFQTDKRARALKHTHATADLVRQEKADVRQDVNYNTGCLTDDDDDEEEEASLRRRLLYNRTLNKFKKNYRSRWMPITTTTPRT